MESTGYRITKVRRHIISILNSNKKPLSAKELLNLLLKKDLSPNKTTIYRELEFFKKQGLIREIEFGDRKKRYELETDRHHHHIVCVNCGRVEDFDFDVDLATHEMQIAKQTGFEIKEHSIEFFGLCKQCQH